jgi:hypothetical protein
VLESAKEPTSFQEIDSMKQKLINYIRAGYPGLYIVSPEEQRVESEIKSIAEAVRFNLFFWSVVDGLVDCKQSSVANANDPLEALQAIEGLDEKSIVLLKDFHLFLSDPNPIIIRKFKDVLQHAKTASKTLIVLGCRLCLRRCHRQ